MKHFYWIFPALLLITFLVCRVEESTVQDSTWPVVMVDTDIAASTTWTAGIVYYVSKPVSVLTGVNLDIQAGTTVKFAAGASLSIASGAKINAGGTAGQAIIFTSILDTAAGGDSLTTDTNTPPTRGCWDALYISSTTANSLAYCDFRFGGTSGEGVLAIESGGNATVDHCTLHDNGLTAPATPETPYNNYQAALNAANASASTSITNCVFYSNAVPLSISASMQLPDSNTFHSGTLVNTYQGVFINCTNAVTSTTWAEAELPLCLYDASPLAIDLNQTLTLGSGVILKLLTVTTAKQWIFIKTSAALIYDGTNIFTSFKDDAHGGDTDGAATTGTKGDWDGILDEGTAIWQTGSNILFATDQGA